MRSSPVLGLLLSVLLSTVPLCAPSALEAQEGDPESVPQEPTSEPVEEAEGVDLMEPAGEDSEDPDQDQDLDADEDGEADDQDGEDEEEEEPPPPRITFRVPFTDEKGGGTATGTAGLLEQSQDVVRASGGVSLKYRDMEIQAEEVEVDVENKIVHARGNVIIDQGPQRIAAESADFDLDTKTGTFYEANAYVDPDIFFLGEEVSKTGENTYEVKNGVFTSCEDEVPEWSFKIPRASIELDGYARARHTTMRIKKLPFLYIPYILWPAKTDRTSGS